MLLTASWPAMTGLMIFCMLMRAIAGYIAEDDPLAITEAVLAAMGRRHAQGARRRPRPSPPRPPSMCFTTIDILAVGVEAVEVAAASTREHHWDDDHPSDCGQHPVGSPLAKPAAARWHFAHQRSQRAGRRAAIAPGGAPTGAPRQDVQATAKRCARRFWFA